jgi:hypothetical protein
MTSEDAVKMLQSLGPLLGVLLGSLISAFVTMMNNWHAASIEDRKLNREELLKREEAALMEREARIDTYHKCIKSLSALAAVARSREDADDAEKNQLWKDAIEHTTRLALLRTDIEGEMRADFHRWVEALDRSTWNTEDLLSVVRKMVVADNRISPNAIAIEVDDPNKRKVQITVDAEFRKSVMVAAGKDIPQHFNFTCNLEQLSPRQRELLWNALSSNNIHKSFILRIPEFRPKEAVKLVLNGAVWNAAIDPTISKPTELFDAWERDYDNALASAKTQAGEQVEAPS